MSQESKFPIATLFYDVEAEEGKEISVEVVAHMLEMLSTLTDFELKVFATEASIILRKRLELPPSPETKP